MPLHSRMLPLCTFVIPLLWSGASLTAETYTLNEATRRAPAETAPASQPATASKASAPTEPAPQDIVQAVAREFRNDPLTSLAGATVTTGGPGEIVITGVVPTLMAKDRATHVAEAVRGVVYVRNELRVAPGVERSANDLESAITQALSANAATDAYDVLVRGGPRGEVSLTGRVGSWAERELAGRVARNVRGVLEVRNDLQIDPAPMRTDLDLQRSIEQLLRWDAYIDGSSVEVAVQDGAVQLSGDARSAAEKRRIVAMAWSAAPQSVNASELRVAVGADEDRGRQSPQAPSSLSPAEISAAVRTIARAQGVGQSDAVNVQVENGVVTLFGEVDSLQTSRALQARAENVVGVTQVRNRLTVRTTTPEIDQLIATRVRSALATNSITDLHEIDVGVVNGVVTLTGKVDTWYERGAADDAAAGVRGVRAVENDLRVARTEQRATHDPFVDSWSIYEYDWYTPQRPRVQQQDAVIAGQIRDELWWSPFIDAEEVRVNVEDGVATLTGQVDSLAERRAAVENAYEGGALQVNSKLRIGE